MQILTGYECEDGRERPESVVVLGPASLLYLPRSNVPQSGLLPDALLKHLTCPFDWTREVSHAWPGCLENFEVSPAHAGFWDKWVAGEPSFPGRQMGE